MEEATWPPIAVMGAGAVGCYFGGMLARAGAPVTLIGRPGHVAAMTQSGLVLETSRFQDSVPVTAATDAGAVRGAQIVLLCVKTLDTEGAAVALAPHLAPGAVVVSLQNGVDNVGRIRSVAGIEAIAAVVYVGAQMVAPGHVKHTARGDLIIGGTADGRRLEQLAALFIRAGVPCRISDHMEADLWAKLIINCAYNAMSALSQAQYGRVASNGYTRQVMRKAVEEGIDVAGAAGVQFGNLDLVEAARKLGEAMPGAISSTAQDISRGKRTEIDALNGYVVRRGEELGVATPVNQTLHALIKLLEESGVSPNPCP